LLRCFRQNCSDQFFATKNRCLQRNSLLTPASSLRRSIWHLSFFVDRGYFRVAGPLCLRGAILPQLALLSRV